MLIAPKKRSIIDKKLNFDSKIWHRNSTPIMVEIEELQSYFAFNSPVCEIKTRHMGRQLGYYCITSNGEGRWIEYDSDMPFYEIYDVASSIAIAPDVKSPDPVSDEDLVMDVIEWRYIKDENDLSEVHKEINKGVTKGG